MSHRKNILRPHGHLLADIFLELRTCIVRKVASEVIEAAPVENDTVKVLICCKILQKSKDVILHIGMDRIEELLVCPHVHYRPETIVSIKYSRMLPHLRITEQDTVLTKARLMSAAERIESGIHPQACLMTFLYEGLEVIPIGMPLHLDITAVDPCSHELHLLALISLEEHVSTSTCRSDIENDISESAVSDLCHITCYVLPAVSIVLEVGITLDPNEAALACRLCGTIIGVICFAGIIGIIGNYRCIGISPAKFVELGTHIQTTVRT